MKLFAYLTRFTSTDQPVPKRLIEIPDEKIEDPNDAEELLEWAFHYGQNMFQPRKGLYSLSVGDIVELPNGDLYRVQPVGFVKVEGSIEDQPRGRGADDAVYADEMARVREARAEQELIRLYEERKAK